MYLREIPELTLSEFADMVNDTTEAVQVSGTEIALDLQDEHTITIGQATIPATREGIEALGRHLRVPPAFLYPSDRAFDAEEAQYILGRRLQRMGDTVSIHHSPSGITGVYAPGAQPINPRRVVEVAMHVMDPASQIIEYRSSSDEMFFDVAVPLDSVTTGDPTTTLVRPDGEQQVGDLTAAGLRFTQNRARNLTPTVDPFAYRLFCTNGMSLLDTNLPKVDARILDGIDDVMRALEARAEAAFSAVEQQIAHFYDLRNQPIEGDATQALRRMAREHNVPDRIALRLIDRLPAEIPDGEQATMFHLVNLLTNEANNPAVSMTGRRSLEMAGGAVVSVHSDRCGHCQSRLN